MTILIKCNMCERIETVPTNNSNTRPPSKWVKLQLSATGDGSSDYETSVIHACNDCVFKFKLKKQEGESDRSAADKLFDIFIDMAEEARDE